MKAQKIIDGNKLIVEFMGWKFIENCIQHTDLYECGDGMGEDSIENIWVLNPTEQFLKIKRFGMWVRGEYYNEEDPYDEWHYEHGLKYNKSWEWLMPVVEKIESIQDEYQGRFGVHIVSNTCTIQSTKFRPDKRIPDPPYYFDDVILDSKIESTWYAVVNFIKWYINNGKNS